MEFKVGDYVKVKPLHEIYKIAGLTIPTYQHDGFDDYVRNIYFNSKMASCCGKIYKVEKLHYFPIKTCKLILPKEVSRDRGHWSWHFDWLIPAPTKTEGEESNDLKWLMS